MDKKVIISILTGKATKKQMGVCFFSVLGFLAIMWLLAQFNYPGGYFFLKNYISDQGWIKNNPNGYMYFTIGAVITGILLIPYILYLYRNFLPTFKPLSILAASCGIIGAVGFAFVGLIPKDFSEPHSTAADFAFGGLAALIFFSMFVLLIKLIKKEAWPKLYQFAILYGITITLLTFTIIFQNIEPESFPINIDPRWFTWIPWQWISFFNVMIWLINIYFIIPEPKNRQSIAN